MFVGMYVISRLSVNVLRRWSYVCGGVVCWSFVFQLGQYHG